MTRQHTVHYIHQFRERRAILEAALFLIKQGRFQNSAIRDIAFHAKLAESTTLHFFPNRATLLDDLELFIVEEVNAAIADALATSPDLRKRMVTTWKALTKFYGRNPGIMKFIDQSALILEDTSRVAKFLEEINRQLIDCLNEVPGVFTPRQAVSIFHISIISAAKLTSEQFVTLSPDHLEVLAMSTWNTISKKPTTPLAKLPPVEELPG